MIGTQKTKEINKATLLILEKANDCMRKAMLSWFFCVRVVPSARRQSTLGGWEVGGGQPWKGAF